MRTKLFISLLLSINLAFSESSSNINSQSDNFAVLNLEEGNRIVEFLAKKKLKTAQEIYNFCLTIRKNNSNQSGIRKKLSERIIFNENALKKKCPDNMIKYCYEKNPNAPESLYLKRELQVYAVRLLGGTLCRCCAPFEIRKQEDYYILTGKELQKDNPINKKSKEEFYEWSGSLRAQLYEVLLQKVSSSVN